MISFKNFKVGDIFRFVNPKGKLTTRELIEGNDIPYVAAKKTNNGISKMCSKENIPDEQIMEGNCIVFIQQGDGAAGYTTYQPYPFYAISCVCCGYIDGVLNEKIGMYLMASLDKNKQFYSHSQSWNMDKIKNTTLSLPVIARTVPDWSALQDICMGVGGGISMNEIDTSTWKEFKLDDIFEKISVEKIQGKAGDFPEERDEEHQIPLLTAGTTNHGLNRYAKREQCPTILQNVISISANGDGIAFYQDEEFAVLQDSYAIKPKDGDIQSKEVGIFLEACINKIIKGNYNWNNKSGWNNIKNECIKLPAKNEEVIDWNYMENFIQELECERIQELDAYLKATGLNDYTLTDEDKNVLVKFIGNNGVTKQDILKLISGFTPPREKPELIKYKIFKVKDFFEIQKTKSYDSYYLNNGNQYDYVTRSVSNRGVISHTNKID